jgi:hypothetical protein
MAENGQPPGRALAAAWNFAGQIRAGQMQMAGIESRPLSVALCSAAF